MPQLDFSVFPSQFFWLLVNFLLMLFIMRKFIIPKTAEMINLRKEKIDSDIEKAKEIKQKAEVMVNNYNQALQKANAKANLTLQENRDELNELISRRQEDLLARLNDEIKNGEEKIANSKLKALQKIEDVSAELAVDILGKLGFGGIKMKDAKNTLTSLKKEQ